MWDLAAQYEAGSGGIAPAAALASATCEIQMVYPMLFWFYC